MAGLLVVLTLLLTSATITTNTYTPQQKETTQLSINKEQLRTLIQVVLKEIDGAIPYNEIAVELLMLTCATESNLGEYITQIKGPAKGIFQMEPATERDIIENYCRYKPEFAALVEEYKSHGGSDLTGNIPYQIVMARLHYRRSKVPLPTSSDPTAMAMVWKSVYNTHLGKGQVGEAVRKYLKYA